jgi:predicted nucleic acid-binding protein
LAARPPTAHRYSITRDEVDEFCQRLERESIWLPDPVDPPRVVPSDAGDDYLIQLAIDGDADALVTRDYHFDGIRVPGLRILPPRAIVPRLSP